ncbi:MAG TPA: hypothetical protein VM925_26130 [Labilithrix sp.]|nr:hypothetical protein [Labilithrix sp.]
MFPRVLSSSFAVLVVGLVAGGLRGLAGCDSAPAGDAAGDREAGSPPRGGQVGEAGTEEAGVIPVPSCVEAPGRDTTASRVLEDGAGTASVEASGAACARSFVLSSNADRRDDLPASPRTVAERAGRPSLSTRSDLFDALYQLALDEAAEASVAEIRDGAFRNGEPVACAESGCFETGRTWTYVWTRDTAYAADLGLGWVDPRRAASSLDFKLSTLRGGQSLEIVQDTGTGGSWPVSTDRAVWALGAREILRRLGGPARALFRDRAFAAIVATEERDREVVYDDRDGLYRGEQSFLDWRDQSYPGWTVPDVVTIATSKALSTNLAHLALLRTGAELADEKGDVATKATFTTRAEALRTAIREKLWLAEDDQFSTYLTTDLDPAPARRFDLLGLSLAVLLDVATPEQARASLAAYPTLPKGPPVLFPQQQSTPIYHNRAIWPFVTAYWVRAAKKAENDAAYDVGVRSLVRGAALFLSNMENLEVVTGKPWVDDGVYSGPVVNSQRQIWSVAGYLAMVNQGIFGVEATGEGARIAPFVTKALRRTLFAASDALVLNDLPLRDKKLTVVLHLPSASSGEGAYRVARVKLNGQAEGGGQLLESALLARNLVEVDLEEPAGPGASVRTITDVSNYRVLYAPRTPSLSNLHVAEGKLTFSIDRAGEAAADVELSLYRDGVRVANALSGVTSSWSDPATSGETSPSHCYTVEQRYVATGNVSQRARPVCFWGTSNARIASIPASSFTVTGGSATTAYGRYFYEAWGDPGHTITATFTASRTGEHLLQAVYGNGSGGLTTGITCAVKRVVVEELPAATVVASGYFVMPQRGDWSSWGDSSFVRATLQAGKTYRVRLDNDGKATNMSAFAHFADYTGGTGGSSGPFFRVNVAELKVLARVP